MLPVGCAQALTQRHHLRASRHSHRHCSVSSRPRAFVLLASLRSTPRCSSASRLLSPADGPCRLLADPSLQAIVHVPTDRAFFNLLRVLGQTKDQLLSEKERANLLQVVQARVVWGHGWLTTYNGAGLRALLSGLPTRLSIPSFK